MYQKKPKNNLHRCRRDSKQLETKKRERTTREFTYGMKAKQQLKLLQINLVAGILEDTSLGDHSWETMGNYIRSGFCTHLQLGDRLDQLAQLYQIHVSSRSSWSTKQINQLTYGILILWAFMGFYGCNQGRSTQDEMCRCFSFFLHDSLLCLHDSLLCLHDSPIMPPRQSIMPPRRSTQNPKKENWKLHNSAPNGTFELPD